MYEYECILPFSNCSNWALFRCQVRPDLSSGDLGPCGEINCSFWNSKIPMTGFAYIQKAFLNDNLRHFHNGYSHFANYEPCLAKTCIFTKKKNLKDLKFKLLSVISSDLLTRPRRGTDSYEVQGVIHPNRPQVYPRSITPLDCYIRANSGVWSICSSTRWPRSYPIFLHQIGLNPIQTFIVAIFACLH